METRLQRQDRFDQIWDYFAEAGRVDGFGGSHYRQVKDDWITAGRPSDIAAFITGS